MRNALRGVIVLVVTAVLAGTAVVVGNAAQLQVNAGQLSVASAGHPCPGQRLAASAGAGADGTTGQLQVTMPASWPDACVGKTIDLAVGTGSTSVTGRLQAPAAGVKTDVTLSNSFTPTTGSPVSAVVEGWSIPVDWTYRAAATCRLTHDVTGWQNVQGVWTPILAPTQSPAGCEVQSVTAGNSWTTGGFTVQQFEVRIRNTSSREAAWAATLDFSQSPFPGWTPRGINGLGNGSGGDAWNAQAVNACSQLPRLEIVGNPGSTQVLRANERLTIAFQIVSGPAGSLVCP